MNKVLSKRIFRDLRENLFRYIALFMLIVLGMYIIVSVVGAAETVITGTAQMAKKNLIEDGQFGVFIPLTEEQEKEITNSGITLEEKFSFDVEGSDSKVLRIMKNRKKIDLVNLDCGRLADKEGEVVLEKRYCQENNISEGDSIKISGYSFTVVGIGSTPDYDLPEKNFGDVSAESSSFGLAFVTDSQYEKIKTGSVQKVEDYCYAYRLNGKMSDDDLKEKIKDFSFDYTKVDDIYFQEIIDDTIGKKQDLQDGINNLYDGTNELADGLGTLDENGNSLNDGANSIFDVFLSQANSVLLQNNITETLTAENYNDVLSKYISATNSSALLNLKNTLNSLKEYCDGIKEYTDGVHDAKIGSIDLVDGVGKLKDGTDDLLDEYFDVDIDNLTSFITAGDNPRIGAASGDVIINKEFGMVAGVIVMILFAYVISVFVVHQIQSESSVIGTLYALGVKKKNLLINYITLPTVICFVGGIIGAGIGFSAVGIDVQMADTYEYFSLPDFTAVYPPYLIIYSVVMPPIVAAVVNLLVINKRLSRTALSLIRNEKKTKSYRNIKLKNIGFVRSFQIRQILRETRTGITVIIAMIISLLIFMLSLNCYVLCKNIGIENTADTKYEYMYTFKYPKTTVPTGGEAVYSESLSKTSLGYTLDVNVMGIDSKNKYFEVDTVKGKSNVIISSSVAQKYGLSEGDTLVLSDSANDMDYAFNVKGVANYSVGLSVFMDIDSMRELFGQEEDYYNVVLSDKALDIDEGRLYSVTTKADIERSSVVFSDLMMPMVVTMTVVAVLIFFMVMYLMMKVMIDRASTGISLIKIFGYRTNEIRKLYLNGNLIIVVLGAIIGIPVSKHIMDLMFPTFIANVACGINLTYKWYYYLIIFAVIIILYLFINTLLVRRLKNISPADILKNRE